MHEFILPDMSCGHCVASVTRVVKALDATAEVVVDLSKHQVQVNSALSRETLAQALIEDGYPPQ